MTHRELATRHSNNGDNVYGAVIENDSVPIQLAQYRFRGLAISNTDVKNVQIKVKKTLKSKQRDKNIKNVCKRNKKRYLFLV